MPIANYNMDEDFVTHGQWWLPDASDVKVFGTLKYELGETLLELRGSFAPRMLHEFMSGHGECRLPVIHGMSDNGEHITLLESDISESMVGPHCALSSYSSLFAIIGRHTAGIDDLALRSIRFGCTGLESFLGKRVFKDCRDSDDESRPTGYTVSYQRPDDIVCRLASNLDLVFGSSMSMSHGRTSISLTHRSSVTMKGTPALGLEKRLQDMFKLCGVISLLSDEQTRPTWVQISLEDDNSHERHWLLYQRESVKVDRIHVTALLLLPGSLIYERLTSIIERWFSATDAMLNSMSLFMLVRQSGSTSESVRFLMATQALEAFSRATGQDKYMSQELYDKDVLPIINGAIPGIVEGSHRTSLKQRLKFANEFSFRKRLNLLLKGLEPSTIQCVCQDDSKFVEGVLDTRNYLVHYTDSLRPKALVGADLLWAGEKLVMLLRILLLKEVGIEESLIVQRLREHNRLMQYMHIWRNFRECC